MKSQSTLWVVLSLLVPPAAIGMPFRLARTIIGILSLVAFIFVMFQSCAANVVNAMEANTADASAGGGIHPAYCGHYNGSGAR